MASTPCDLQACWRMNYSTVRREPGVTYYLPHCLVEDRSVLGRTSDYVERIPKGSSKWVWALSVCRFTHIHAHVSISMHKCTCAGMGVHKWTCICTWVYMPLKSTPWAHPIHCTLGKQCAPPLTSGPESISCRGVSTDLANNTQQTLMYSLKVTWFVDFYRNPLNRHFKGGKIGILSVQSSCFCEAKAAFELVNNPWLSAILTGMVFGIWNAAFNGSVPRKMRKSFEGPQSVKSNPTWHHQLCIWKGMRLSREAQGAKVTYLSNEL